MRDHLDIPKTRFQQIKISNGFQEQKSYGYNFSRGQKILSHRVMKFTDMGKWEFIGSFNVVFDVVDVQYEVVRETEWHDDYWKLTPKTML